MKKENIKLSPQFWRDYVTLRKKSLPQKKVASGKKWDQMAKRYQNFADDKDFVAELEWLKTGMLNRNMLRSDLDVLDMSCGPGTHCFGFAEICHQVTAVDVSEKMIAQVEMQKKSRGTKNLTVLRQDFADFQASDLYDTVFVSMSPILNELDNIDRLLAMSRRYLVLTYWAGVRENSLFQRCYRLIYGTEYSFDALDLTIVFNYLHALGFSPEISYLHPVWRRRDTLENTINYIIWHLEFYRELTASEKTAVQELVATKADSDGMVTYYTKVRKGALFLDKHAGFAEVS